MSTSTTLLVRVHYRIIYSVCNIEEESERKMNDMNGKPAVGGSDLTCRVRVHTFTLSLTLHSNKLGWKISLSPFP